jgi:SAM-dependent methyltransferase
VTSARKRLGAWYTPPELVSTVVDRVVTSEFVRSRSGRALHVLDPACGDGRFLAAVAQRVRAAGGECELVGVDIDPAAVRAARADVARADIVHADALTHDFAGRRFDVVIGNPPFLSQMASATTRGGTSSRSGGPYADTAVEFLALAGEVVEPHGGRVALVLPQSILAARDAQRVRANFDARARMFWSWWTGERAFDAQVHTCALAFEFGAPAPLAPEDSAVPERPPGNWTGVVTSRHAIPHLPVLATNGCLADRATLNANFRDEYYGMVPAVADHPAGPPLITSGLIDPGRSRWGERPVTFAKRRLQSPRIDLAALDPKMQRWAAKRLVPKVLVANQTAIIEAVCDDRGEFLPAVPVVAVYPGRGGTLFDPGPVEAELVWQIAAVLTSPVASAWAWHRQAGTGLSAGTIRLGPVLLGELPWPAGRLDAAVGALRGDDVPGCGSAVLDAYAVDSAVDRDRLLTWWLTAVERIDHRARATT